MDNLFWRGPPGLKGSYEFVDRSPLLFSAVLFPFLPLVHHFPSFTISLRDLSGRVSPEATLLIAELSLRPSVTAIALVEYLQQFCKIHMDVRKKKKKRDETRL